MSKRYYQEYGPVERRRKTGELDDSPYTTQRLPEVEQTGPRYEQPHSREVARPRRRSPWKPLLWLMVPLLLIAAIAGGGLYYLDQRFDGKIYPNVAVYGIDVGEMTPEQATAALNDKLDEFTSQPVVITFGTQRWTPTLEELGVTVGAEEAIDEAYGTGRSLNLVTSLQEVQQVWQAGRQIDLHISIDQAVMKRYLESLASTVERPPVDANLLIEEFTAKMTPAQNGRVMLIDETAAELTAGIEALEPQIVALRTRDLDPALRDAGVAEAQRTVDAILSGPIMLTMPDREWEISQDDLRALLTIERIKEPSGDALHVKINELAVRQRMVAIADEIGRGSVNPRVAFDNGALTIVRPGQAGMRLDEEASAARVIENITSSQRTIELVVKEVAPDVTPENIHSLGIVEAVGVGQSSFAGSAPYRITNIKAGSRLLDGLLIGPGEEFSFNNAVGSISEANGFVEGYAIIGNRTQLEYGGGICQDSTTLFRAAFHGGLPFTEWHHHSFRINWYEVFEPYGMDATIFTGALDLRFVNDTGHWMLLNAYVDEQSQSLTYVLYGTKPNRQVYRSDPIVTNEVPAPTEPVYVADPEIPVGQFKQTDTARGGMTITIYRTIYSDGVMISQEPFITTFKPWPDIFLHNPNTPLPPKGCSPLKPCPALQPTPAPQPTPDPAQPPAPQPEPTPAPQPEPTPVPQPEPQPEPQPQPEPTPDPNGFGVGSGQPSP